MNTANRFIALTKRILTRKIYILMLLLMVLLTGVYKLLPEKSQSADIKVALYSNETSGYYNQLISYLDDLDSIYTFYTTDSIDELLNDVKSGYAECGYVVPEGFFSDYVLGEAEDNPLKLYITPSSTFHSVINETIFSSIYSVCAEDILIYSANTPEYNEDLSDRLEYYRNSEEVFTIADTTNGTFTFDSMVYRISLPVTETVTIVILFSALLGLLLFLHDRERKIYDSLPDKQIKAVKLLSVLTAILPVMITGMVCLTISHGFNLIILFILIVAILSFFVTMLLSLVIRKSTLLEKVLPLIMLIALIAVFIKTII